MGKIRKADNELKEENFPSGPDGDAVYECTKGSERFFN